MLGNKIRQIRKLKNITLGDVARKTELSSSYLSQLERGIIEPSLSSIRKIAQALDVPAYALFTNNSDQSVVIRGSDQRNFMFENSSIKYRLLSPPMSNGKINPQMIIIQFEMEPNSLISTEFLVHEESDECIFIQEGTLDVYLDEEKYIMHPGDSLYISQNTPHRMCNTTNEKVIGISNISPPGKIQ